jgi:hypothetical protein
MVFVLVPRPPVAGARLLGVDADIGRAVVIVHCSERIAAMPQRLKYVIIQ